MWNQQDVFSSLPTSLLTAFNQAYIKSQNLKREREASVHSSPQLWQLPVWTKEQDDDDAGFGAGERPPGGPLLWPLLGPALSLRACSTSAADTALPRGDGAQVLHDCPLLLQPASCQRGSWEIVFYLTASMMLSYCLVYDKPWALSSCCACRQCWKVFSLMYVEWSVQNDNTE